jgi:uncharacterized protein YcfJ
MGRTGFCLAINGGGSPAHAYLGGVALADVAGPAPRCFGFTVGEDTGRRIATIAGAIG